MADAAPNIDPATGEPKISKRQAEKEAKKAAAKAKKEASKSAATAAGPTPKEAIDPFRQGWLKGVYNEKPVKDVYTRFPPEPNGYLHIGHAKAITVNFGFAKSYGGVCNLRFDDTNPVKEEARYFESIKEMVAWLGFTPHKITYSSDEFDQLYEYAEQLTKQGKAYVCKCTKEQMQKGRGGAKGEGERSVCEHWYRSPEDNLEDFRAMRDGKYEEGQAILRMKQYLGTRPDQYAVTADDTSETKQAKMKLKRLAENPAMWDAAAYRIKKNNHHYRTGDKWRIYGTYDFVHAICDQIEGVTHSLCTVEFETLRPSYDLLLCELGLKTPDSEEKGPMQREYGRLNVEGTILSKRRIQMLVEGATIADKPKEQDITAALDTVKLEDEDEEEDESADNSAAIASSGRKIPPAVRDWDDPRLFTLVALRRRGVPPGALKKFVLDLGVTKAGANTMTHTLDSSIRVYLERTVPRLMLVVDPIKVVLSNLPDDYLEERETPYDPKDPTKGTHKLPFTRIIYIDRDDFREADDPDFFRLSPSQSVGLLNVEHPIRVSSVSKDEAGKVVAIDAEYGAHLPAGKARIHWVADSAKHDSPVKAEVRFFNALFKTSKPNELDWKSGGYHDNLNPDSEIVYRHALVETGFREIQAKAPWPKEEGEATGVVDKSSVRFQGLRTAFYCEDKDSTAEHVVLNRIVSLKEDTGKK